MTYKVNYFNIKYSRENAREADFTKERVGRFAISVRPLFDRIYPLRVKGGKLADKNTCGSVRAITRRVTSARFKATTSENALET